MTATTSHVATDPATGQQHEFTTLDDLARQFGGNRWRTAGWAGTPPDWQWVIQLYDFPNPAATDACKIVKILRVHHSVWASETS